MSHTICLVSHLHIKAMFTYTILINYATADCTGPQALGPRPLLVRGQFRNRAIQQEGKGRGAGEASPVFKATSQGFVLEPEPAARQTAALDIHRRVSPTVNCACQGRRLHTPCENLTPDELRRSWAGDAGAGEGTGVRCTRKGCQEVNWLEKWSPWSTIKWCVSVKATWDLRLQQTFPLALCH